ncbi:MAG: thymidylate kinase [Thermoanaerobaculum sp.]|nr:MAG: thymidylate kinase [Thermoanaerobaculum sp.]
MAGGIFVSFEGIEGCGKSTQLSLLAQELQRRGVKVVTTREPGGTPLGEEIRALLLNPAFSPTPWAELFLLEAARAQLVATVIRPALEEGAWVLADRFSDSSLAYQAGGRGLPWAQVRALNRMATGGLLPHRTLVLTLPVSQALTRARNRASTQASNRRFEDEAEAFHRRVARAFQRLATQEPQRVRLVDGRGSTSQVHARVLKELSELLP